MWAGKVAGVALQVLRALPSLRVTVAGEVRRIVFSEEGVVVATDLVSANADYNNGVRVHGSARFRRRDERPTRRVEALEQERAAAVLRFLLL